MSTVEKVDRKPLTVTQLTARIRGRLEGEFARVSVEGEISTWSAAPSGHAYFSIKDEGALLSCVLWRSGRAKLNFSPSTGTKVVCTGSISVFEKRGQYQLIVDSLRKSGEGELWARFQAMKEKLEREGLFAAERKRPLPTYPRAIGVVTSPTGAAVRDIINIVTRRAPGLSILIYPSRVQGDGAAAEIARGVRTLAASGVVDVLIVGRGGGSMEDLWEFNDEQLARTIGESQIPVISAVGHETDFSISDFVADLRAPTPSAAAEIVTEGYLNLREFFQDGLRRSRRAVETRLRQFRTHVNGILASHALRRPELLLRDFQQRTDVALRRMPELVHRRIERQRASIERLAGSLEGHNPHLILKKGYAIVRKPGDGTPITRAGILRRNAQIDIELRDGRRRAVITDEEAPDLFA